ncbi:MAG: GNAT family N-acetyltransferase [Parvularculaceae bacterium]
MGEIVNLGRIRKKKKSAEKEKQASENRAKFGRTRAEREMTEKEATNARKLHEGHERISSNNKNLIFRIASHDELTEVARLRLLLKNEDALPNAADIDILAAALAGEQDDLVHWLAISDGEAAAAMSVRLVRKAPKPGAPNARWGYLTNVYTAPKWRNTGVGSQLLGKLKEWARHERLEFLIVWPSDRARTFYERAEFKSPADVMILDLE